MQLYHGVSGTRRKKMGSNRKGFSGFYLALGAFLVANSLSAYELNLDLPTASSESRQYVEALHDLAVDRDWFTFSRHYEEWVNRCEREGANNSSRTFFITPRNTPGNWITVLRDLQNLLRNGGRDAWAAHDLSSGGRARNLLEEAKLTADWKKMLSLVAYYRFTQAGNEALELLATHFLDRKQYQAAAVCFEDLIHHELSEIQTLTLYKATLAFAAAGLEEKRESTWRTLETRLGRQSLRLESGREMPLARLGAYIDVQFPRRSNDLPPRFEQVVWHMPQRVERGPERRHVDERTALFVEPLSTPFWALSSFYTHSFERFVTYRSPWGLHQVDISSGELRWAVPTSGGLDGERGTNILDSIIQTRQDLSLWGYLNSARGYSYIVESAQEGALTDNVITVYESRSGRRLWNYRPGFEDGRFLGPPSPVDTHLYTAVQAQSGIHVLSSDARARGRMNWKARVGSVAAENVDGRIPVILSRALIPVYANGHAIMMVSPDVVVAIDTVLNVPVWVTDVKGNGSGRDRNHWAQAPIIIDGHVFMINSSGAIYGLDLSSGKLLWTRPGSFAFIQDCRDLILAVQRDRVHAYSVADGTLRWTALTGPVSGRGFATNNQYFLPLTSGEIAIITLSTGALEKGRPPGSRISPYGNLFYMNNTVIQHSLLETTAWR